MADIFDRTKLLIGEENFEKLSKSNILVVGVGGVGGYCLEVLARAGVQNFTIVDGDNVDVTNINRQIIALQSTVGKPKVNVFCERLKDINPNINLRCFDFRFNEQTCCKIFDQNYDYVVDAIDSVQDKLLLIKTAKEHNFNIISAMGAGNRFELSDFQVVDIFKTTNDKLAKKMRKLLKDNGIFSLNTVCSSTIPSKVDGNTIASISYMPPLAGIKMAGYIINQLIKNK